MRETIGGDHETNDDRAPDVCVATESDEPRSATKFAIRRAVVAAAIYFVVFCIFTWPWIAHVKSDFFATTSDGYQNVWNIWWIDHAVTHLHQSPWHTNLLHYPHGTTLVAQTLNPFNGFVAIPLMHVMSIVHVFNLLVIFSFVFTGVTAFWLCEFVSKRFVPSLIGGAVFTFSTYHLSQGRTHMQLVSAEWIPLFILLWWKLLTHPRVRLAVGAAVTLLLVLFCDYYYFLYAVAAGALILGYLAYKRRLPALRARETYLPYALFGGLALLLCAPLPIALLRANSEDKLLGSHSSRSFSADLLAPFINGGLWRFNSLTRGYWSNLPGNVYESSIYVGIPVLVVLVVALVKRNALHPDTWFWIGFSGVFALLSLGPRLMVWGNSYSAVPLPYALLEHFISAFKLGGTPVRMFVMTTLGLAVLSAIVLSKLDLHNRAHVALLVGFVVVLAVEMWPADFRYLSPKQPQYAMAVKQLPPGAVLDYTNENEIHTRGQRLYAQLVYDRPMAFGYTSRESRSIHELEQKLQEVVRARQFDQLCPEFKLRYFIAPPTLERPPLYPVVYRDGEAVIYDVKNSPDC